MWVENRGREGVATMDHLGASYAADWGTCFAWVWGRIDSLCWSLGAFGVVRWNLCRRQDYAIPGWTVGWRSDGRTFWVFLSDGLGVAVACFGQVKGICKASIESIVSIFAVQYKLYQNTASANT